MDFLNLQFEGQLSLNFSYCVGGAYPLRIRSVFSIFALREQYEYKNKLNKIQNE